MQLRKCRRSDVKGGPHALRPETQARDTAKNSRKRAAPVQPARLRRSYDQRTDGARRVEPRRLLPPFQRQGRALCRGGALVSLRGGAETVAGKTKIRGETQAARPARRGRLFLPRSFRRPGELLSAHRA